MFNEIVAVLVVIEDIAALDSASRDMVQGTGSIDSGLAWYDNRYQISDGLESLNNESVP